MMGHFSPAPGSLIEQGAGGASSAFGDFWPRLTQEGIGAEAWKTYALLLVLLGHGKVVVFSYWIRCLMLWGRD